MTLLGVGARARLLAAAFYITGIGTCWLAGCGDDAGDDDDHDHSADEGDAAADHDHDDEEIGTPSGAVCPDDSTLTYANFGQQFMEDYCTRCHSRDRMGADRHDAPLDHDFDWYMGILFVSDHIDQMAAAGPDSVNTMMPLDEPRPSMEEREKLGEWLACGAPE
jgi:hypothetical protein